MRRGATKLPVSNSATTGSPTTTTNIPRLGSRCEQAECLQYALDAREPFGIWGGKTHTQRARMLRRDTTLPGVVHAVGSEVEYKRHLAQATTPCVACRRAHAIFNAEKRQQLKVST